MTWTNPPRDAKLPGTILLESGKGKPGNCAFNTINYCKKHAGAQPVFGYTIHLWDGQPMRANDGHWVALHKGRYIDPTGESDDGGNYNFFEPLKVCDVQQAKAWLHGKNVTCTSRYPSL